MPPLDRMVPIYRTGARPRREAFFVAGPPQGKNAPSGGSDPRSGERGGAFFAAGPPQGKNAPSGGSDPRSGERGGLSLPPAAPVPAAFERLASGRHFGKIVIRVDA